MVVSSPNYSTRAFLPCVVSFVPSLSSDLDLLPSSLPLLSLFSPSSLPLLSLFLCSPQRIDSHNALILKKTYSFVYFNQRLLYITSYRNLRFSA